MKTKATLLSLSLLILHIGAANAAVVVQTESNASQTFFTANATDLVNAGQSTLGSITANVPLTYVGAAGVPALNNGATGAVDTLGDIALANDGAGSNGTITMVLDTTTNTFGYDIRAVQSIAAWQGVRFNQTYQLFYATVSAPSTYISLGSVSTGLGGGGGSTRVTFYNDVSPGVASIASGVKSLQLTFQVASLATDSTATTAFREIDVFGAAAVPEPSTYAMLIIGGAAIVFGRLRRKCTRY